MGKCYASKLIAWAAKEVGYLEKATNADLDDPVKNAGHANWNKFAAYIDANYPEWYNGKKNGYDWCDVFFDCGMLQCFGYEDALRLTCQPEKSCGAGCKYSLGYYKSKGRFFTSEPKKGDQIFFGTSLENVSHTGLVRAVDTMVRTFEGNVSDGVRECAYPLNSAKILGYGRPDYDPEPDPVEEAPETPECGCTAMEKDVATLRDEVAALQTQLKVYDTVDELPSWATEARRLVEQGKLHGDGKRLRITEDMARILEVLKRDTE